MSADPIPSTHRLQPPIRRQPGVSAPPWPSYTGSAQQVGKSSLGVTVYVDPTLGAPALQNARDLLAAADGVVQQNNTIFGITGGPVDVIVFAVNGKTDGTGGADHGGCDFTVGNAIEVDASYNQSTRVVALFEAELSECAMGGNLCGASTGEALSRWCAAVVGSNALADYATAPIWVQDGQADWVDRTEQTDQDADSIGCGMAFLSWLLSQTYPLPHIAQTMVSLTATGTLAQLYSSLTGDAAGNAWPKFTSALNSLPGGVVSDDPFNGLAQVSTSVGNFR